MSPLELCVQSTFLDDTSKIFMSGNKDTKFSLSFFIYSFNNPLTTPPRELDG